MINWDNLGELTAATCKRSAVPQRPVECHESPKDWPLRSGPASGQHHAADAAFWMDDHLCDVVLKSYDGAEHHAHMAVLSAASVFFKNLLGGPFLEAQRVQQKQQWKSLRPKRHCVHCLTTSWWAAWSTGGGWSWTPTTCRCFRLAKLAVNCGMHPCPLGLQCRPASSARPYVLHSLSAASGDKVVEEFEICSQHPYLGKLSASQLTRILTREDLSISREETVMNAILTWNKFPRRTCLWHAAATCAFPSTLHWEFAAPSRNNSLRSRMVTTFTRELRMLWAPERESDVQVGLSRRGLVSGIGHHF